MSMIFEMVAISNGVLDYLVKNEDEVEDFFFAREEGEAFGRFTEEEVLFDCDLNSEWHLLHFALTGSEDESDAPLNNVIFGGTPIGEDLGYGPATYLTSDQVHALVQSLPSVDQFTAHVEDLEIPESVHGASNGVTAEERDGMVHYFAEVRQYLEEAAERGFGVLRLIS
ncbi:MAG: YfbM family protein [Bacilli bacterium]